MSYIKSAYFIVTGPGKKNRRDSFTVISSFHTGFFTSSSSEETSVSSEEDESDGSSDVKHSKKSSKRKKGKKQAKSKKEVYRGKGVGI